MPDTCVVILNWNNADKTLRCLDSLQRAQAKDSQVIVVDNGSSDNSCERIRRTFENITCIETGANLGYAGGNNIGIRYALEQQARFVFVLNNDTEVATDALACLMAAAHQHPQAAFFGPTIMTMESPSMIQSAGIVLDGCWRSLHRRAGEPDRSADSAPQPVDCLSGAALFIRAEALGKIGLLDPDFFLYREDIDWCLRAQKQGYQVMFVPGAKIWHYSHTAQEEDLPRITYYMTRNSLLLIDRNRGGWLRLSAVLFRFLTTSLSWTFRPRWKHKRGERDALMQGIRDYFHHRFGQGPY